MSQYVSSVCHDQYRQMQYWSQVAPVLHHHGYRQLEVYHFVHEVMLFLYYAAVCKLTGMLHKKHSYSKITHLRILVYAQEL